MSATFTEAVNYVLRRMRESEVSTPPASGYSTLVGDFVNESKREVEDIHDWQNLRTDIELTMVQGQHEYAVTGSTTRGRMLNIWHNQDFYHLHKGVPRNIKAQLAMTADEGRPSQYFMSGNDGTDRKVTFWIRPNATVQTLSCEIVVPQDDFVIGTEEFSVPHWPIYLGAYARALDERGDDQGNALTKANGAYASAIADAVAHDITDIEGESNWFED